MQTNSLKIGLEIIAIANRVPGFQDYLKKIGIDDISFYKDKPRELASKIQYYLNQGADNESKTV